MAIDELLSECDRLRGGDAGAVDALKIALDTESAARAAKEADRG